MCRISWLMCSRFQPHNSEYSCPDTRAPARGIIEKDHAPALYCGLKDVARRSDGPLGVCSGGMPHA